LIAALAGSLLGILKIKAAPGRGMSPYQGWHKWHHLLGLACMIFVVSWIFSGWLSMDSGRLFSTGAPDSADTAKLVGAPAWKDWSNVEWRLSAAVKEIEWFPWDGKIYRRERTGLDAQRLVALGAGAPSAPHAFLGASEISASVGRIAAGCMAPTVIAADDSYAIPSSMPGAPVYRSVCGDVWYHVDGASGALLERSDRSSRAYRWLYSALHTMDLPALKARPALRSALIVTLCGFGFLFSLTGVVIGWRRLRLQFSAHAANGG
jgi:hypothetical protein